MAKHVNNSIFAPQQKLQLSGKEQRDVKNAFQNEWRPSSPKSVADSIAIDRVIFSDTKSVRFGSCQIRSYNQVLGDNPSVSAGCPIQLGWKVVSTKSVPVDEFEALKGGRHKTFEEMKLSAQQRRIILGDLNDVEIQREWRMIHRQARRKSDSVKEGMKQFRQIGAYYAGF